MDVQTEKLSKLRRILRGYGSCVIAYSGGVDSTFLAFVAHQELGDRALAVIADTPSLPRRELREALELASRLGFRVAVVNTNEFSIGSYIANLKDRCYHCKRELFTALRRVANEGSYAVILYGENASDTNDYRPGIQAASEFNARAPLKEAGLTKADIRALSAHLGLPTADKPEMACLSSRVPYGQPLTPHKLGMIEQAEGFLRDMGFRELRVRHHEFPATKGLAATTLARIELGPDELPRLFNDNAWKRVAATLREIGYNYVTLDLEGYRRGSLNEVLAGDRQSGT